MVRDDAAVAREFAWGLLSRPTHISGVLILFHTEPPMNIPSTACVFRRLGLLVFLLLLTRVTSASAQDAGASAADAEPSYYYAIVIGINDYHGSMPKLQTAVADAQAIAKVLQDGYGFDVKLLTDGQATRAAIKQALRDYRGKAGTNDNLLIYYAGHGNQDADANRAFWLPADSVTDEPDEPASIMSDDITEAIKLMRARHVLVISDSCYSGGLGQHGKTTVLTSNSIDYLKKMMQRSSLHIMSSGGKAPVLDGGRDGHSPFAAALLKQLNERDDPAFSASSIFDYVEEIVESQTQHTQQPYYFQIVDIKRNVNAGDFIFSKKGASLSTIAAPPQTAPPTVPAAGTATPATGATAPAAPQAVVSVDYNTGAAYYADGQYSKALPYLNRSCTAGVWKACGALGNMYEDGDGVKVDNSRAFAFYKTACDGGHMLSCSDQGYFYDQGLGVQKDMVQAVKLYSKACTGGSAIGCTNLGELYSSGEGVAKDSARAAALFRLSCKGGDAPGCTSLGNLYAAGEGVAKDAVRAAAAYKKACDGDDAEGCDDLGNMYSDGDGVAQDDKRAFTLYEKACDLDPAVGCSDLAGMYEDGKGVAEDVDTAIKFYKQACKAKDQDGCDAVKELKN